MKFFNNTETTYTYYVATAFAKQKTMLVGPDPIRGPGYQAYADSYNFMTVCVGEWNGMGGVRMEAWTESGPTLFNTLDEAKTMASCLPKSVFEFDLIPDTVRLYKVTRHSSVTFDVQEQP